MTELDAQAPPPDEDPTNTEPTSDPPGGEAPAEPPEALGDGGEQLVEPEAATDSETATESPALTESERETGSSAAPTEEGDGAATEPAGDTGPRTVGRFIADALRSAGVRYAFTVPGESFLGLLDAFEDAGIRVIATRHEGAAAFMADAHGQLTGRPAVCLGTRAVGGANLAIGIHTAHQNSTPFFAAVGQVERPFLGREAFQEIDQVATLGGLAKWAAQPRDAASVAATMTEAIQKAIGGRPGPVLLALSEDLLDETMPDDARIEGGRPANPARATIRSVR
jgi:hypothetical protein